MQYYHHARALPPCRRLTPGTWPRATEAMKNLYKSTSGAIVAPLGAANVISDAICTNMAGKWNLNHINGLSKLTPGRDLAQKTAT